MTWTCPCEWPMRRDASTCWCGGALRPMRRAPVAPILSTEDCARESVSYEGMTFREAKIAAHKRFVRDYYAPLYERCAGNISAVARESGVDNRRQVRLHLRQAGIR